MADEEKGQRWPSTAELDLQRRQEEEQDESARLSALQGGAGQVSEANAPYAVEDNDTSNYVGVSPEYMTYASDTEKPMRAEEGALAALEEKALQATPVRQASVKENNQTQGEGTTFETVYPATSGEGFTSEKVESSSVDGGSVTGGGTELNQGDREPAKATAPAKKAAPTKPASDDK